MNMKMMIVVVVIVIIIILKKMRKHIQCKTGNAFRHDSGLSHYGVITLCRLICPFRDLSSVKISLMS